MRKWIAGISFILVYVIAISVLRGYPVSADPMQIKAFADINVTIDPGHGGFDPGAIGAVTRVKESTLNLAIALRLEELLESAGANVTMTRYSDEGVMSDEQKTTTKRADMNERYRIIKGSEADIVISIHMNSFSQASVHGAQVFFQKGSVEGKVLAETIAAELSAMEENTKREALKGDFMMLKASDAPSVIVECGFLSNPNDEANLIKEEYQQRVAWCIYSALAKYIGRA